MQDKVLGLIGLATRAGKVITGIELCEKAVKSHRAQLVILTNETSASTCDIFLHHKIPVIYVESKEMLGRYTGKEYRSVAVITDKGLAQAVLKKARNVNAAENKGS
jgi:ribosomal protein L7Ae-like RNA K-turn-binding protein